MITKKQVKKNTVQIAEADSTSTWPATNTEKYLEESEEAKCRKLVKHLEIEFQILFNESQRILEFYRSLQTK